MCLAIPSKVISIDKDKNTAIIETLGVCREASLDLMQEEVAVGEYVLLHIGYIMSKIDTQSALESIALYEQIVEDMEDEYIDEEYK
ncbi:HypC/HybG/HupF family hydrogenase formation chaperone [Helicobacter fennelliae]|uniref:[NiFe] hydrogenase metallocenter assembly protein HypC n=2 Tax=Helicobacter fennelliae TaxID=215 RepID=T1D0H0_9HELI|nr:HypC/HybG/HupF family hydrogenase formation chaperone [Helicobacter fennelliae]GAD19695.1 [NiFe] hydrogenase metallocenter assembly protein HypC [Helicobacter fennelliae MRY12-0050]SQB99614.1 hydrogenase isoenzymes formation protein [Helicobacter fennelliae]STP07262.1 hydrogenase isoenzymes formation protein [Helicobacter fennelliae]STQ85154.1 hydrogenase isoenzymes formation protein [Helicobacter fennelliae]